MSSVFGAPVNVPSRTPNVEASTVNTTYFPFTRKLSPTLLAATVVFCLPETPSTENPFRLQPADEAAKATSGISKIDDAAHAASTSACRTLRLISVSTRRCRSRVNRFTQEPDICEAADGTDFFVTIRIGGEETECTIPSLGERC